MPLGQVLILLSSILSLKHGFEVDEELLYAFGASFNPPELNIIFKARIRGR